MKIETYYNILYYLKNVIKGCEFDGHVYSVGGCERDKHLGMNEIKDIDLVVDLKDGGIRFARWLHSMGLVQNGNIVVYENFGTAMFKLSAFPDEEIEVVHTRKETYRDKNSRNPETAFGTINEDCFRRDFTINALYHNISTDEDLDLTGLGLTDLEEGLIRTCSEPEIIFSDDPLRIMRAVRFASRLGFRIDAETENGIKNHANRLEIISRERITDEFNKILMCKNPTLGFSMLWNYGILDVIMPNVYRKDQYQRMYNQLKSISESRHYTLETALGVLLNKLNISNESKEMVLKSFKYSNDIIKEVNLYATYSWNLELACALKLAEKVREIARICGDNEHFKNLVSVAFATLLRKNHPEVYDFIYDVENIEMMFGYKLPVNGDDVMDVLNIPPGVEVKKILDKLMEAAYCDPKISKGTCMKLIKEYGSAS